MKPVSRGRRAGGLDRVIEGEDGGESDIERAARGEGERREGCDGRGWRRKERL